MEEFNNFLQEVTLLSGRLVMLGDFNFHLDEPERSDVSSFLSLLDSFGLTNHVDKPTHRSGHIIDLIITRDDDDLVRLCDVGIDHGSDHMMIRSILQQRKPPPLKVECTMRDFRKVDSIALKSDLNLQLNHDVDLQVGGDVNHNVNDMLWHFNNVSLNVLDKYAPSTTRSRLVRPRPPWYTDQIRSEKREQRRLERKWKKSRHDDDRDAYRKQHTHYNKTLEASKKQYYNEKLSGAGPKETFQTIGVLLNQNVKILPTLYTPDVLSNKIGHFFTEKVDKIRASISSDSVDSMICCTDDMYTDVVIQNDLNSFRELTQKEVCNIIMGCTNKSCHLDCLPTWLVKENIDVVLPRITQIVNTSLNSGVFPEDLKQAVVTPVLKKITLDWNDFKNYRPISNIAFMGKIIEKAAIIQVNEHMQANDLEEVFQSAYKNKHSTETALIKVKNDITLALDDNMAVFLIMLDLSAAFDTIDHDILLHRLEHGFGIKGTSLKWFDSYITDRHFKVSVASVMSDKFALNCGVPQGSIIGPRVFTMYAQHVACIIRRHGLNFHIYADDVQIYMIFNPRAPGDAACAMFKLTSCVEELRVWLMNNMLKLNDSKTEFFIAASKYNITRFSDTTIQIGCAKIAPSPTIKNLGITFDSAMTMSDHITSMCKSINFILWNLAKIRRFIDQDASSNAMRALVLSKLDYGNALLIGCKCKDLARLQRLQNRAARIVYQVPRRHSTSPLLNSLHWLPVEKRIRFKILLHVFKVLNGLSPIYLTDYIATYIPSREGLRSEVDVTRLVIPRSTRKMGDSSFSVSGPTLWNQLPQTIRTSLTVEIFKKCLKSYLF